MRFSIYVNKLRYPWTGSFYITLCPLWRNSVSIRLGRYQICAELIRL